MLDQLNIKVRDLASSDIKLIADYWLANDEDFLRGMGVDLNKLPPRGSLVHMLNEQIRTHDAEKSSLALILEVNSQPFGHCNVNDIEFGKKATMHLHLWNAQNRQKGLGTVMVTKSLPEFFRRLELEVIYCEPYALNPAPNHTLKSVGFEFVKRYRTIPGSLNFEQEVNRYQLTRSRFEAMSEPKAQ